MTKRLLLTVVLLIGASGVAQAKQCSAFPDATRGSSSWEWVEGRICWYFGAAVPKESLYWEAPAQATAPRDAAATSRKTAAQPAQKTECRARAAGPGPWRWRTVDGRQCWFVGTRDTPRETLHWPAGQKRELPRENANVAVAPPSNPAPIRVKTVELPAPESGAPEHPGHTGIDSPESAAEPSPLADAHPWQLVNLEAGGDLEFLAVGDPVRSPLSINLNVGNEYLTRVPVTHWPRLAQISRR